MSSIFGTQLTSAKKERAKVVDSLTDIVQADMSKIEDILSEKVFSSQSAYIDPTKRKKTTSDIKRRLARCPALKTLYQLKERSLPDVEVLSKRYEIDEKVLAAGGYSFGYLVILSDLVEMQYATKKNVIADGVSDFIRPFLMSLDLTKVSKVTVMKGKVVDLNLINTVSDNWYAHVYAYIAVKVDPSRFKAALSSLKATGNGANLILSDIYHKVINGSPVPPFFTRKIEFKNSIEPKAYLMPSGRVVYIPDLAFGEVQKQIDTIKMTLADRKQFEAGSVQRLPRDCVFFPDADTSSLICTDNHGYLTSYSMSGMLDPDNKYKLHLLNKPITFFLERGLGGLSSYIPLDYSTDIYQSINSLYETYGRDTLIMDLIGKPDFSKIIDVCIAYGASRYGSLLLTNWMSFMGIMYVLKGLKNDAKAIVTEIAAKEAKFKKCTPDDAPALPNMRADSVRFPHQAEALAKLNVAVDSAIIDVSTGGGKANIIIQDCINLLNKGLIRRPLIVMPNNLVSQFLSEISFFTDNQVNGFALTSSVSARRGIDELTRMVKEAPPNTIFVTTFSWLSKGGSFDDYDMDGEVVKSFESTDWLKREIGVDYVAVDESQNIKNMSSAAFKAVMSLGRGIKYKRISTGTLISNKPTDLVGQLMFLDPLLIGTKKDFDTKYAVKGDGKNGYKSSMAEDIRARLRTGSSYIMYREKDWAPLLPKKVYSFSRVEQTPEQAKVYKSLVEDTLDEIKSDPSLARAWKELTEEGESMDSVPTALLGKLTRLEMFLTAPDSSTLMQYANLNSVSPKVKEIDRLISKSLAMKGPNNKVIVAVHYKSSARHLLKHSKHGDIAAYYDASQKDLIPKFQDPNSKLKVIFAVVQSIKEGLNLQIANRIIIADIDWTPGNLKQLEARVFRPHVKIGDGGKVTNLNAGKTVYIDTVIADDSADCVKYAFQSYKKILNSIIMEECPVDTPRKVPFSEEALSAKFTDPVINGEALVDKIDQFNKWNQEEIDASLKKGDLKFRLVKTTKSNIGTEIVETPWIKGMTLPAGTDEEPLLTYLESLGLNTDADDLDEDDDEGGNFDFDLTNFTSDLMGVRVRVEYGNGRIYNVRKTSVLVRLANGETVSANPNVVLHKIGSVGKGLTKKDLKKGLEHKTIGIRKAKRLVHDAFDTAGKVDNGASEKKTKKVGGTGDNSHDPGVIKAYFKEKGIKYVRQTNAAGEKRCTLRYEGEELYVQTAFFKDLPLSDWKTYADMIIGGRTGTFDPSGKALDTKSTDVALEPNSSKVRSDKALDTKSTDVALEPNSSKVRSDKALNERKKVKKALDEGDSGAGLTNRKVVNTRTTTEKSKEEISDTRAGLDAYLDDDFDFLTPEKPASKKPTAKVEKSTKVEKPGQVKKIPSMDLEHSEDIKLEEDGVNILVASYNNIPSLLSFDAGSGEELQDIGFTWTGNYWRYPVTNLQRAKATLIKLIEDFAIPEENLTSINQCLGEFKRGIYKTAFPEEGVKAFLLQNKRKVKKGNMRLYPLVAGSEFFLVVDVDTHPGVNMSSYLFKKKEGYYIYTAPTLTALKTKFREVLKTVEVINEEDAKKLSWDHLKIRIA